MVVTTDIKVIKFPEGSDVVELLNRAKSKFLKENPGKNGFDYEVVLSALRRY
jgi:hypothetical protein